MFDAVAFDTRIGETSPMTPTPMPTAARPTDTLVKTSAVDFRLLASAQASDAQSLVVSSLALRAAARVPSAVTVNRPAAPKPT